jgi:hypothetical protein
MAQVLNEQFIRMQKLAGVITEGEYKMKMEAATEPTSPEQAANLVVDKYLPKLVASPEFETTAEKMANDPQAMKELAKFMEKQGIPVNEGDVNVSNDLLKRVAAKYAAKASEQEKQTVTEESEYGWQFWVGMLGGGALARYVSNLIHNTPDHARMGAAILGGLAASALLYLGTYIYDKLKD